MIKSLSTFFYRFSTPKNVLILLGLYTLTAILLAISPLSSIETPFDLKFGYDTDFAQTFLSSLTLEQRKSYVLFLLTYDLIYPIVYGGLLISLLSYFNPLKKKGIINLLPLIIVISDYIENSCSIYTTLHFPEIQANIIAVGSFFTMLKWTLIGISIVMVLVFLIMKLIKKL